MREAIERVIAELNDMYQAETKEIPSTWMQALGKSGWIYASIRAKAYAEAIQKLKAVLAEHETGSPS